MTFHFHRRNLPHLYFNDGIYFITYRLANSIPVDKLNLIKSPFTNPNFEEYKKLFIRYDKLLDSGNYGINYLSQQNIADVCKESIHYSDSKHYKLICYCIMPNHVHLVFELSPGSKDISQIMKAIKGISANRANKILNRKGTFWQDESYDRLVRDDVELYFVIKYVLLNPVKAGLVDNWSDWRNTYCRPDFITV